MWLLNKIQDYYDLTVIKSTQITCKYIPSLNYTQITPYINLSLHSTLVISGLCVALCAINKTKNIFYDIGIGISYYAIVGLSSKCSITFDIYKSQYVRHIELLCEYNKNILDLSNMNQNEDYEIYTLIGILETSTAHTIKLYGWKMDNYKINVIYHNIFVQNKFINHIFFDTQQNVNQESLKYIQNMKCKNSNLLFILLLKKHCKYQFNISKDIIRHIIMPYLQI